MGWLGKDPQEYLNQIPKGSKSISESIHKIGTSCLKDEPKRLWPSKLKCFSLLNTYNIQ